MVELQVNLIMHDGLEQPLKYFCTKILKLQIRDQPRMFPVE